jgi:hypothetical protein
MSKISNWPFQDPQNVAVFTTKHIVRNHKPVLFVSHDAEDGAWQFHSGDIARDEDVMIIALSEMVEIDSTIMELADLPLGWEAVRNSTLEPWIRRQHE